jgi:Flp pilus assembly protein TadG
MHHRLRKIRHDRRLRRLGWLARFRRNEQGVQLIEAAIVLPLMVIMFAAVAEFGRYFYEYTTAAKAARLGARFMSSKTLETGNVNWQAQATNLVVYGNTAGSGTPVLPGFSAANVQFSYSGGSYVNGNGNPGRVTVSIVNYKHQPIFDLAKFTKTSVTTAVDVKPSVTMAYFLTAQSN